MTLEYKVCSRHDQSIGRVHETVNKLHESNVRIETKLDVLVKSTNGMHDTIYGKDGLQENSITTKQQLKNMVWLLGIVVAGIVGSAFWMFRTK